MTHKDDLHAAEMPEEQPSMELLDGAEPGNPPRRSLLGRVFRGTLYGVMLLSASALLAISAVPELANYATVIPDVKTKSHCSAKSACTALNVATFENTPCCLNSEASLASEGGCSRSCGRKTNLASTDGCSDSCEKSEMLASIAAGLRSCCRDESSATDVDLVDEAPAQPLLTDEQLALLPEGEDLD
ncbi:MAG: hypothetical protein R3C02_01480 [Planctomycetaceae bacterium]